MSIFTVRNERLKNLVSNVLTSFQGIRIASSSGATFVMWIVMGEVNYGNRE